jgi:hypothetical protein
MSVGGFMSVKKFGFLFMVVFFLISTTAFAIESKLAVTCEQNINDKLYKTISEDAPQFSDVDWVVKKQYFSILLFFTKYKINDEKIANIKYDIKIETPQKGTYYEQKGIDAIHQKIDNPDLTLLGKTNLKVCFEPEDHFGTYQIVVKVYDENSNEVSTSQSSVTLKEFKNESFFKDDDSFLKWLANYYSNPTPNKAIDAYSYYSKSKLSEDQDGFISMFSIFLELFDANHYLVPHLINIYSDQGEKTRTLIIYLLRYLNYDSSEFLNALKGHGKEVYQKILTEQFPRSQDAIKSPSHLDIQWATFLATGKIEPIQKLISVLEFSKYSGSVENYDDSPKTEIDKQNALKDAIFQAACWFLESNGKKHPLVGQYCTYLFLKGELTKNERLWTGAALSKVYPDKFKIKKEESGIWSVDMVK